jgi:hypothetical protein
MSPILISIRKLCEAKIGEHKSNIEVFLANPVGVGEHIDYAGPVLSQLEQIEKYASILEVIEQYF